MTAANVPQGQHPPPLVAPAVGEVVDMFVRHNPQTPRKIAERAGRLTAALGAAAAKLSIQQQIDLAANKEKFGDLFVAMLADLQPRPEHDDTPTLIEQGAGLGQQLGAAEGRRRLQAYATPMKIEDWAGPVAGPSELERNYGIRRSTLHDWQKQRAVIGLLAGQRKHVFPITQFIDGRPVEGLAGVVSQVGSPRTAWLWLVEPHPSLRGARPLDRLKAGETALVIELAERDFGQS